MFEKTTGARPYEIRVLAPGEFPPQLCEIPQPPKKLYCVGEVPRTDLYLAVVGSRKYTDYGRRVCQMLIQGLRGASVTIVSGLAIGIDALAHETALECGLPTIAVPGSGLGAEVLYPKQNRELAERIVAPSAGGGARSCLLSEFEPDFRATDWSFPQRNRIMAGLSHATLVIEAHQKSGTLITARLALDYNRQVLTVPGSVLSSASDGTNWLLKQGATPISSVDDLRAALGLAAISATDSQATLFDHVLSQATPDEQKILTLLRAEPKNRDELLDESGLSSMQTSIAVSGLEIKGLIEEQLGRFVLK